MTFALPRVKPSLVALVFAVAAWGSAEDTCPADTRAGEVAVLEGDGLVSDIDGIALGLRFDEEQDDLGAVARRFVEQIGDREATLVVFTTFEDAGGGGPAYSVPIRSAVTGIGLPEIDQRSLFGADRLLAFVDMKRFDSQRDPEKTLAHELAHRFLAYMSAKTSSRTIDLTGRQQAHWDARLHTDGSLMGGYGYEEVESGRFRVVAREGGFSLLDLYGLGLASPAEVEPFFFIEGAKKNGFDIPIAAELAIGAEIEGRRLDLDITQVIEAIGRRVPEREGPLHAVFALVTRPGESATSTVVMAEAEKIDRFRVEMEDAWRTFTRERGTLCTTIDGCTPAPLPVEGCDCTTARGDDPWLFALALAALRLSRWRRARSCHRPRRSGARPPPPCFRHRSRKPSSS